jgi:hypothetical protein
MNIAGHYYINSTECTDVSKTKRETDIPESAIDKLIEDQKEYELERERERQRVRVSQ